MGDRPARHKVELKKLSPKEAKGTINGKKFVSTYYLKYKTPRWKHIVAGIPATQGEAGTITGVITRRERADMLADLAKHDTKPW